MKEIIVRLDQRIQAVDEPRWLSSRYAQPAHRDALIVLYAVYYELARVRLVVSDQTLGNIRFQWWRDVVREIAAGQVREHETVIALAAQMDFGTWTSDALIELIDQHEAAFLAGDRALEPDLLLVQCAALALGQTVDQNHPLGLIAPEWAALRRGERVDQGQPRAQIDSALRPAAAHFRLRHLWQKSATLSPLRQRGSILLAMLSGRV